MRMAFASALILISGCFGKLEIEGEPSPYGGPFDEQEASSLWLQIAGRDGWPAFAGYDGFFENGAPHGAFGRLFVNTIAAEDPTALPIGSVIVKHDYVDQDEGALDSITMIARIDNFNPEAGDWFWARFELDGSLSTDDDGRPLAGKIGMGGEMGCIPCHQSAPGADFVFLNGDRP